MFSIILSGAIASALLLTTAMQSSPPANVLFYSSEAQSWNEALPIGNGRLGAMVFGGVSHERLQLNEDSIWAGSKSERDRKGAHRFLKEARDLFFEGRFKDGQELMQREFMSERWVRSYQTLGDLTFDFEPKGEIKDYRRELDLDSAIATTRFSDESGEHVRTIFASPSDQVIVVQWEASRPGAITTKVSLSRIERAKVEVCENSQIVLRGRAFQGDAHPGVRFEAQLRVRVDGGSVRQDGDSLFVENASAVTMVLSAGTDYWEREPSARAAEDGFQGFARSYEELRQAHVIEHQRLFRRCSLTLGGEADTNAKRLIPTDERLRAVQRGEVDLDLFATFFQFGRYLLISSSRPGSMPANLQGLWSEHIEAPWNSDYHININMQMNYWPAESTNLSECHLPFLEFVERLPESGRETAKELYDCRGWVAHHTTDAWGFTSPIGRTVWGLWPTGGAWCTRHFLEHYLYGGDKVFLRNRAFPILAEAAQFFLDYLVEDPQTGYLVSGPSSSPENQFRVGDQVADTCMGASMDQQIIYDLFTNLLEAASILEIDTDFIKEVRETQAKLAPPKIGEDGRLLEWTQPFEEVEPGHRHMSHLFGLHPGRQFGMGNGDDLAKAARRSLEDRLKNGGGHTGWSRAWILNFFARLHDGEKAMEHLQLLMQKSVLTNLFDNHPPFQIDGNFGATAGIAEMLLQSHSEEVDLLPALPMAWSEGDVRGLRARGGLEVDIAWHDGRFQRATLKAHRDLEQNVRLGDVVTLVKLRAGESINLHGLQLEIERS